MREAKWEINERFEASSVRSKASRLQLESGMRIEKRQRDYQYLYEYSLSWEKTGAGEALAAIAGGLLCSL